MNRKIAWWMLVGLAVACCWAAIGLLLEPSGYNLGRSTLVAITAPASVVGRKMPLGVVSFILLNGLIYAIVGFALELVRSLQFRKHP